MAYIEGSNIENVLYYGLAVTISNFNKTVLKLNFEQPLNTTMVESISMSGDVINLE